MKKLLSVILISSLSVSAMGQIVNITLDQQSKVQQKREQITHDQNDYKKTVNKEKTFTLTLKATTQQNVIVIFCVTEGGQFKCTPFTGKIYPNKPIVFIEGGAASSEKTEIKFYGRRPDIKVQYGNDKVEAAAYVFSGNGKYLGMKCTSKAFADTIMKNSKKEMAALVKEMCN